ncbi:MAG: hypothetical protein J6Q49_02065 [Kiritimatiellae bacterium]|nr:hypothetical protein [Kiritimatiellia bacterium]
MIKMMIAAAALATTVLAAAAEGEYDFRRRLEVVHQADRRDPGAKRAANEFEFASGAAIVSVGGEPDGLLVRAAVDFQDYLRVSMKVDAIVRSGDSADGGAQALVVKLDRSLGARASRIEVGENVVVSCGSERAALQALAHLEDLMNLRGGPFLKKGVESREAIFDVRMSHSGYGNDIFPDEHLAQMAHFGITAIIVFLDDIDKTKAQEYQDLKALMRRAARHGLDTYLYSYIKAFAHPADEGGKEAIDAAYGRIAGHYPEAKGIILVGESCQFPSKDPRVQSVLYTDKDPNDRRPLAGWFPCADYPEWLRAVEDAIHARAPRQELVFWTYNWGWAPEADRMKLIDALPRDVTLMATFEMFERRTLRNGIETPTADYTISFPGPGKYFVSEADRSKRNGLKLYTQANAAGLTWDFGCVPYQPVPHQWNRRWRALVEANGRWGLSGIMENHHFGWWPGFVAELENEAFFRGGIPFERHLRLIAARDYGEENADAAIAVWKKWSDDAADYVPTDCNQYGTFRIGPAYPFTFGHAPVKRNEFPGKRYASNWPADICRMDYIREGFVPQLTPERMDDAYFAKEIELLEPMARHYAEGERAFAAMAAKLDGRRRRRALEMSNFAGYLAACCRTAINVKRGAIAFRTGDNGALLAAARDEYANAKAALKFVEADSRLGWEPSMEYCGGPEQIRWKLGLMERLYGFPDCGTTAASAMFPARRCISR